LPIAVLSVTAEWSQRTGLTTFTLVPHRGRVPLAKALACGLVALAATAVASTVGALGSLTGAAMAGIDPVWNQTLTDVGYFALGSTLLLLVRFTLGALIRNSPGAIVGYMIYAFVAPGLLAFLAFNQTWFHDARPWVDPKFNQDTLLHRNLSGDCRTHLAVTTSRLAGAPSDDRGPQPASLRGQVTIRSKTLKQRVRGNGKSPFVGFFDAKGPCCDTCIISVSAGRSRPTIRRGGRRCSILAPCQ
jgi:hypothetical protein